MPVPMLAKMSRRAFVRAAAILAVRHVAHAQPGKLADLPRFDGALDIDLRAREELAVDVGRNIRRVPLAVLRPKSFSDVVTLVRYAHRHGIKVAMRGQGHSQYGQTLVADGIVIDSSTLASVSPVDDSAVDVGAGATWGAITRATAAKGLTPPAMPDTMHLSAGGILSVGGWGNTSHRYGGVIDNVTELDVVTGEGQLTTCSEARNRDLFEASLAGLGQCGLIVRARLRLVKAPSAVVLEQLDYSELKPFIDDVTRFAVDDSFDHLEPRIVRADDGRWTYRIMAGRFEFGEPPRSVKKGVRIVSYAEYLARTEPELAALRSARHTGPRRSGSVTMFLPASATPDFVAQTLSSRTETAGLWRYGCAPMLTKRYGRPLFKLPDADVVFGLWLFRAVAADDKQAGAAMDEGTKSLFGRMQTVGGKFYVPYSGFPSQDVWRRHYGPDWDRFAAAKKRFDPAGVLTPGPGIF